jgi:hypothetical protein
LAWSDFPLFLSSRFLVVLPAASFIRPLASWALFDALSATPFSYSFA